MTELLNQYLGEEYALYATIAIALVAVVILIAVFFRIIRAFRGGSFGRAGQSRLGVLEYLTLENKHRLVLIRRDNVEHLILIGGASDIVVEQGISRHQKPAEKQPSNMQTGQQMAPTTPPANQGVPNVTPTASVAPGAVAAPIVSATIPAQTAPVVATEPHMAALSPMMPMPEIEPQFENASPSLPIQDATSKADNPLTAFSDMIKPDEPEVTSGTGKTQTSGVASAPSTNDSAKVDGNMQRVVNQIAGD